MSETTNLQHFSVYVTGGFEDSAEKQLFQLRVTTELEKVRATKTVGLGMASILWHQGL